MAVMPLGALALYFGGFGPMEVIGWGVTLLWVSALMAVVSAVLSFGSSGVVLPFMMSLGYAFLVFLVVPIGIAIQTEGISSFGDFGLHLTPYAYWLNPDLSLLYPLAYVLPVMVRLFHKGAAMMTRSMDGGFDDRRSLWGGWPGSFMGHVLVLGALFTVGFAVVTSQRFGGQLFGGQLWVLLAMSCVALYSASILYIRAALLLTRLMGRTKTRVGRPFRWLPQRGNPVLWREWVTRGQGAAGRVWWVMAGLWLAVLGLSVLKEGPEQLFDTEVNALMVGFAAYLSHLAGAMLVTASVNGERERGTLALLQGTTFSSLRVVLGKVVATFLLTAPVWVMAVGLLFFSALLEHGDWFLIVSPASLVGVEPGNYGRFIQSLHINFPFAGFLTATMWLSLVHLAVIAWSAVVALWMPSKRLSWGLNMSGALGLPVMALMLALGVEVLKDLRLVSRSVRDDMFEMIMPFFDERWVVLHGASIESLLAIGFWMGVVTTALLLATLRLRSRVVGG